MPLCTLVPDVDTVTVKLGSGAPGIWAGSSCGMPIGRISHHDHPTFGIPRQGVTSSVTSEPTAKQAQTVSGAKHFVHRICDLSFLKLASPEKTGPRIEQAQPYHAKPRTTVAANCYARYPHSRPRQCAQTARRISRHRARPAKGGKAHQKPYRVIKKPGKADARVACSAGGAPFWGGSRENGSRVPGIRGKLSRACR